MATRAEIYERRPFKIRNADEFQLEDLLELFVAPVDGLLVSPFEYENNIIKGRMGAGKTMYLRANYAYYLYSIVPALLDAQQVTLPVFIRLSDFQHIRQPDLIYREIILAILQELCDLPTQLADAERLANLHRGLQSLPPNTLLGPREDLLKKILKMKAEEYVERVSDSLGLKAGTKHKFFEVSGEYKRDALLEIRGKESPGIADVYEAYTRLVGPTGGNLLLLIDEAGALDRSFFSNSEGSSLFETLMNQLRTAPYIRTKVAVYPQSYSDILAETRYGDVILLTDNVQSRDGYNRFRARAVSLIDRYTRLASGAEMGARDLFDIEDEKDAVGDGLEQLIFASEGNARRLVRLLDQSLGRAYQEHRGEGRVTREHVEECLSAHTRAAEDNYPEADRTFLEAIATVCRARSTYRFQFPYKAPVLSKYVSQSEEHNLLKIVDPGLGRRGTTYAFDYAYCVARDIPTHVLRDTEKIDRNRSYKDGTWASRVAKISEDLVGQANIPKEDGKIIYLKGKSGFIQTEQIRDYYFTSQHLVESDRDRPLSLGQKVRFYPAEMGDSRYAFLVELIY
jgi:hypothetical protein